jgi:ribosomal protein S18 acetylase RimI-like enzyme
VSLRLRPAERRDAAELAVLVDMASHGFASWLWNGAVRDGEADTPLERGRAVMMEDGQPGAWEDATLAEWDGVVAGVAIGYDLDEGVRGIAAANPVIAPLLELQATVIGSRFIDSLGVYRRHRGKGIGRALLAEEIDKAPGGRVSLITESWNDRAQSLYRANGFIERARLAAVPLFEGSKTHDWVLMARGMT